MQSDQGHHQCPCRPQRGQDELWAAYKHPTQCDGCLYQTGTGIMTGYQPLVQQKSRKINHDVMQSDQGHHQCPCRPQRGQDEIWPAYTHPTQCVGSLYFVRIGLHRISTTSTTEILHNQS